MSRAQEDIRQRLFDLQDIEFKEFSSKLTPAVDPKTVIGVRIPHLRKLAKEYSGRPEAAEFLKNLPHAYFEENNLHGILIEKIMDFDTAVTAVDEFLPYIDNWATCDVISPNVFSMHLSELYGMINVWLESELTYTVRFAVGMLLRFYLDGHFHPEILERVAGIRSDEYYINMMIAWYFATALAKQYDAALPYIRETRLDRWTHNKAIQKAIESRRIGNDVKDYLRTLKIK